MFPPDGLPVVFVKGHSCSDRINKPLLLGMKLFVAIIVQTRKLLRQLLNG